MTGEGRTDPWRPHLHFSPRRHWINDPNGLIWHDGEYHLFFQFNPEGDQWGHMSWGHAVSTDLLHWRELPVAVPEDERWSAFSGSCVLDRANASGLGQRGHPPLLAFYTGAGREPPHNQVQCLAASVDGGRTFEKYAGNPLLDLGLTDFRDPKVFWHAEGGRWVMLVSRAVEGRLAFYGSSDLRQWQPLSEFTVALPEGCRVWECPDLLRVPIAAEGSAPARHAWVLKFDVFAGHPAGGSGGLVVVGNFDGERFVATQAPQWIDGGRDFYAAIAFAEMPPGDARCVWLGWMSDHRYAKATPTVGWRGAMTLPRELTLLPAAQGGQLAQQPVRELLTWRSGLPLLAQGPRPAGRHWLVAPGALPVAQDIEFEIDTATGWTLGVRAGGEPGAGEVTRLRADAARGELVLDRGDAGVAVPEGDFLSRQAVAWAGAGSRRQRLRIVVDACSVEVFADDGRAVLTSLVFPQPGATGLWLEAAGPVADLQCRAWALAAPAR